MRNTEIEHTAPTFSSILYTIKLLNFPGISQAAMLWWNVFSDIVGWIRPADLRFDISVLKVASIAMHCGK